MSDALKEAAARAALDEVGIGATIGIGTGSTAEAFIRLLAERVRDGLDVEGVCTSERSERLCGELGVRTTTLDRVPRLSVAVDGADEIGPELALIKGGGGALLREKIVAAAADRFVVIADETKLVERLGRFPLPVEVEPFGIEPTRLAVGRIARAHGAHGELVLRLDGAEPFVTDGGHHILDVAFGVVADPDALARDLVAVPGVVEHGLFLQMASVAYVAGPAGVRKLERPA